MFIVRYSGYYKLFQERFGNPGLLALSLLIFLLLGNPLFQKLELLIWKGLRYLEQRFIRPEEWQKHFGEKNQWSGKRKAITAGLVGFLFSFTFLIFGPYELFIGGRKDIEFDFADFWWPMLLIGLFATAVILIIAMLLKKRKGDLFLCLVLGVTLAGYLQGNFMNMDLGSLGGAIIEWSKYYPQAFWNTIIWILVIGSVFLLYYMKKELWRTAVIWIPVLLIGMQLSGLVSLLLTIDLSRTNEAYLSTEKEFELAKEDNILVFVLDACDTDNIDGILEKDSDFLKPLTGFTYYPNTVSRFLRTFPSVSYILTDDYYDYQVPREEYFDRAWSNPKPLAALKEAGYQTQIFASRISTAGNAKRMQPYVDNVKEEKREIPYLKLSKIMLKLLCYRDMPQVLKPYFWMYTEDINSIQTDGYTTEDLSFYHALTEKRVTVGNAEKEFIYYHLNGSHGPHILNAEIERDSSGKSDVYAQSEACMRIVYEYIAQLKELGMYDSSTIVITADHGEYDTKETGKDAINPIFFVKLPGETGEVKISNIPLINTDIWPTILGPSYEGTAHGEMAIDQVTEDTVRNRQVMSLENDSVLVTYQVGADAQDGAQWVESERLKAKNVDSW